MSEKNEVKTEKASSPVGMEAFKIAEKSESGILVELDLPDGSESGENLTIRGADSKTFQKAKARYNREKLNLHKGFTKSGKKLDPADLAMREADLIRELAANLVVDWSFKDKKGKKIPCTTKAVVSFFKDAPQIQEQVDSVAGQRRYFFNGPSTN